MGAVHTHYVVRTMQYPSGAATAFFFALKDEYDNTYRTNDKRHRTCAFLSVPSGHDHVEMYVMEISKFRVRGAFLISLSAARFVPSRAGTPSTGGSPSPSQWFFAFPTMAER